MYHITFQIYPSILLATFDTVPTHIFANEISFITSYTIYNLPIHFFRNLFFTIKSTFPICETANPLNLPSSILSLQVEMKIFSDIQGMIYIFSLILTSLVFFSSYFWYPSRRVESLKSDAIFFPKYYNWILHCKSP